MNQHERNRQKFYKKEWAVYKGDTFLFIGNTKECMKRFGLSLDTFKYYTYKSSRKRQLNLKDGFLILDLDNLDQVTDENEQAYLEMR